MDDERDDTWAAMQLVAYLMLYMTGLVAVLTVATYFY